MKMATKTAAGLVAYAKAQLGKPYWYGTFGKAASKSLYNAKKKQYPDYYKWAYAGETEKVHDCVGLIKGYLWCDSADDTTPAYVEAQDVSANGMRDRCTAGGAISNIPEVPGVLVFMNHHVGVYIGGGYVVEARGHAYGVVKTKLSARPWTSWGYCPYVTYGKNETKNESKGEKTVNIELTTLRKGANGEQVKTVQRLLIAMKYDLGKLGDDGDFGSKTDEAVRKFQTKKKLESDGIVGKDTWSALLKG